MTRQVTENSGRLLKNADRDPLTSWGAGCIKESKGSQVPGSTFKVGDKDRMDEPKTCRSRLSSLK